MNGSKRPWGCYPTDALNGSGDRGYNTQLIHFYFVCRLHIYLSTIHHAGYLVIYNMLLVYDINIDLLYVFVFSVERLTQYL
jgi:hypothetical protein